MQNIEVEFNTLDEYFIFAINVPFSMNIPLTPDLSCYSASQRIRELDPPFVESYARHLIQDNTYDIMAMMHVSLESN